jgi:peptide/nickel transport system substrate-binding protein
MKRTKYLWLASILVVVGLLAAACGTPAPPPPADTPEPPSEEETPVPAETAAPAPADTPAPTEPPAAEEPIVFTIGVGYEIPNMDPAVGLNDYPGGTAIRACYDPVVRLRGTPVELEPGIAESWESNEDASEWTFYLDKDAVFHDGSPVTADAVAYTFERKVAMQTGNAWMWEGIADENSVTVVDDYTIRWTLSQPYSPFPSTLGYLWVVNPAVVQEHEEDGDWGAGWLLDHEAGSGPMTISRWEPGVLYEFEAVPDYWFGWPHETNPDIFRYVVYRDSAAQRLAMETGEVDWIPDVSGEDFDLLEGTEGIETLIRGTLDFGWIMMNTASDGPTGDPNVRKAMTYAFDYATELQVNTIVKQASTAMPSGLAGAVEYPVQETDLDKAREALAQSAWPNGGFELDHVYIGGFAPEEDVALVFIDSMSKLNITVNVVPTTWGEMVSMCEGPPEDGPDTIHMYAGSPLPDPSGFFGTLFGPDAARGFCTCTNYQPEVVGDLLAEAVSESDEARRTEIYEELQENIWEARPGIILGEMLLLEAHSEHWQADAFTPMYGVIGYLTDYYYIP